MVRASVRLYLPSDTRLAFLEKEIEFSAMPRVGEWIKFKNDQVGDYFAFRVREVTHRENGIPDVMMEPMEDANGKPEFAGREQELDEYVQSYVQEGWLLRSFKKKTG